MPHTKKPRSRKRQERPLLSRAPLESGRPDEKGLRLRLLFYSVAFLAASDGPNGVSTETPASLRFWHPIDRQGVATWRPVMMTSWLTQEALGPVTRVEAPLEAERRRPDALVIDGVGAGWTRAGTAICRKDCSRAFESRPICV